jgi:hypothetical protein
VLEEVVRLPLGVPVQHIPINVIKGQVSSVLVQLQRHEPLPVVEEPEPVFVGLENPSPCFRTASARQVLHRAARTTTTKYLLLQITHSGDTYKYMYQSE